MRKAVLYVLLVGCFGLALLLERLFTRSPASPSHSLAALTAGEGKWTEIPSLPPEDWDPEPPRPVAGTPPGGDGPRGKGSARRDPAPLPAPRTADGPPTPAPQRVVVRPGDSLWSLAATHLGRGALHRDLARWNGLDDDDVLLEGAVLRLTPPAPSSPAEPAPSAADPVTGRIRTHKVAKGETLSGIAERYLQDSSAWTRIRDLNELSSDQVRAGLVLRIPPSR